MTGRLDGRVAVVTGGASGIGAATVRRFVAEGARVIVADVQLDAGRAIAADLGDAARFMATDVTREADVAAAIACALDAFGGLDVMFNNAGIIGVTGPIATLPVDDYERTMAVLLRSVALGMKHAAAAMIPRGRGVILSTSSPAAFAGGMGAHVYSAAKAAIVGLTQSVAAELWHHGIRVNAIVPGRTATPMTDELVRDMTPPGAPARDTSARSERFAQPEHVAAAALFLASDDADFVTGDTLFVDGGLTRAGGPSPFAFGRYAQAGWYGPTSIDG
jgi:NAD(P)-dependent dehydrogenase (short-subunit alcohol dehydrogenase family)